MHKDKDRSFGPGQQLLGLSATINRHINRIQVPGIRPMPSQNIRSQRTLQRCKLKQTRRIPPQNEPHESVAKPAHTVVQDNRVHCKIEVRSRPAFLRHA
jgi:hypothetical protein